MHPPKEPPPAAAPPSSSINEASPEPHNSTAIAPPAPLRSETMELATNHPLPSHPLAAKVHDHPDHDFYAERWFRSLIFFLLLGMILSTLCILFAPIASLITGLHHASIALKGAHLHSLVPTRWVVSWLPIAALHGTINFILFALLWGTPGEWSAVSGWRGRLKMVVVVAAWCASLAFSFVYPLFFDLPNVLWFGGTVAVYVGGAGMQIWWG